MTLIHKSWLAWVAAALLCDMVASVPESLAADDKATPGNGQISTIPEPPSFENFGKNFSISADPAEAATKDAAGTEVFETLTSPNNPAGSWESSGSWFQDTMASVEPRLHNDIDLAAKDYEHFYSWPNLGALAIGIGAVAPIANTSADNSIHHWYQRHVRGETTDEYSQIIGYAGQLWVLLPLGLEGAALAGHTDENYAFDEGWYEWSNRSLRAIAVGGPPMIGLYAILGSSRPDRNDSTWRPFNDIHGVSGHTFMGAVPFLTAASMTDNVYYKVPLIAGSLLTGWSRINDDKHYFSQVALGWWMAYLSVRSVDKTQAERRSYSIAPAWIEDRPGMALEFRY